MNGGEWAKWIENEFNSLAQLRASIEAASAVSIFYLDYQFPLYEHFEKGDWKKGSISPGTAFFPIPHRRDLLPETFVASKFIARAQLCCWSPPAAFAQRQAAQRHEYSPHTDKPDNLYYLFERRIISGDKTTGSAFEYLR
jgi:hypothetical protein